MKKNSIVVGLMILVTAIIMILFLCRGLEKRTDVVLTDYTISEDGEKMKLNMIIKFLQLIWIEKNCMIELICV